MPNVTIKFNLPEDRIDYDIHTKANDMYLALWDFSQYLRNELKYKDAGKEMEAASRQFWEIMNERNINLYEMGN